MNFDNVGNAYLSLFEVAIFKGWIQIMVDAIDSTQIEKQSTKEMNIYICLYFIVFTIFGSFFTMNLFIVIVFGEYYEKAWMEKNGEISYFTENERRREVEMKVYLENKKPLKAIPKPRWKPQIMIFEMVTNKKFEMIILIVIGLNILTVATDHYQATETFILFLDYLNLTFVILFTVECLLKIFALRRYYFEDLWNLFDLILVVLSLFQLVVSNIIEKYLISPALIPILRVIRVVKIRSCLHSTKWAKDIQKLYLTLSASLRPLLFVCFLLFLVMFIYAIFGMFLFMNVDGTNFKTFGQFMVLLLPLSTSAGWDAVLNAVTNQENSIIGYIYLLSFFFFCYIIFSTYTAAIINNYNQINDDVENSLIEEDFDMFFEIWQRFDPEATQYIPYTQLSDFLAELKPPLQIPKPNKYIIIALNIPICKGEMMFYSDVLDVVVYNFFLEACDFEEKVEVRINNEVDCGTTARRTLRKADSKNVAQTPMH
ncbi:Ion trans and/or PKD channel domain containing protein [Asbolus verrucosus]|uniref:Ion trans and/or PKD channel domain containing protein n=1 Tax=Asbolus verrucosus TaxID=1661398 RepID=A0A482WEA8_ASBVE|nr:Ion trans and/or PKD channel domain containing protein [Asbolus verrucosus]